MPKDESGEKSITQKIVIKGMRLRINFFFKKI